MLRTGPAINITLRIRNILLSSRREREKEKIEIQCEWVAIAMMKKRVET